MCSRNGCTDKGRRVVVSYFGYRLAGERHLFLEKIAAIQRHPLPKRCFRYMKVCKIIRQRLLKYEQPKVSTE